MRIHKLKTADHGHFAGADPSAANVSYHSLRLMTSPKVFVIFWGTVANQATVLQFYQDLASSNFVAWANTYYGVSPNNLIGAGSFNGSYTYAVTKKSKVISVSDTDIENELKALLQSAHIPTPDYNTYYAIHFSNYTEVSGFGTTWCAYHSFVNVTINGTIVPLPYGVINDNSLVKNGACGSGFKDMTSYSSHEFMESITDPYWDAPAIYGEWWADSNGK